MNNIIEIIKKPFMWITSTSNLKVFGYLMYSIVIELDKTIPHIMGVWFNQDRNKFILSINPNILQNKVNTSMTDKQICFILCHEMMHILLNHTSRMGEYSNIVANLASDHVINLKLLSESDSNNYIEAPDSMFFIPELKNDESTHNWTSEQVARYITDNYNIQTSIYPILTDGDTDGDTTDGDTDGAEPNNGVDGPTIVKVKLTHKETDNELYTIVSNNTKKGDDKSRQISDSVRQIINELKKRGSGLSKLEQFIDQITKVRIPWHQYFEVIILRNVRVDFESRSWKRINNRYTGMGLTLPGPGEKCELDRIVVIIDTSGSMSLSDLRLAGGVLEDSMSNFNNISIIYHSDGIAKEINIESELFTSDDICHTFYGDGGTSHKEVFDRIEDIDDCQMIILISDFYSDIHTITKKKYSFFETVCCIAISTSQFDKSQVEALNKAIHNFHHLTTQDIIMK